jgi:hypothetical protein
MSNLFPLKSDGFYASFFSSSLTKFIPGSESRTGVENLILLQYNLMLSSEKSQTKEQTVQQKNGWCLQFALNCHKKFEVKTTEMWIEIIDRMLDLCQIAGEHDMRNLNITNCCDYYEKQLLKEQYKFFSIKKLKALYGFESVEFLTHLEKHKLACSSDNPLIINDVRAHESRNTSLTAINERNAKRIKDEINSLKNLIYALIDNDTTWTLVKHRLNHPTCYANKTVVVNDECEMKSKIVDLTDGDEQELTKHVHNYCLEFTKVKYHRITVLKDKQFDEKNKQKLALVQEGENDTKILNYKLNKKRKVTNTEFKPNLEGMCFSICFS